MAIRQRRQKWQVDVVVGKVRHRESFATQAEAITREAELKVQAFVPASGEPVLTLGELRERVIERVWNGNRSSRTARITSALVVKHFGADTPITKITTEGVDGFIRAMERQGLSPATINRKLSSLSTMLRFAEERGHLSRRPRFKQKRESSGRVRFLSADEESRLLALLLLWGATDEHDLVTFLIDTGARVGEALGLKWEDVAASRVTFWDTKNGVPRSVPLTGRVRSLLLARRVLPRPFPLKYERVHDTWTRMRDHLGFAEDEQFVMHMLRHTCASRLVQNGASIMKVKEWLGHKNIQMTMRYAHLSPTSLDDLVQYLEPTKPPRPLGLVEGGQT